MEIRFSGYNIQPQFLRSDKSIRILIDISHDQLENVQDILLQKLPDGIYEVKISPKIENGEQKNNWAGGHARISGNNFLQGILNIAYSLTIPSHNLSGNKTMRIIIEVLEVVILLTAFIWAVKAITKKK